MIKNLWSKASTKITVRNTLMLVCITLFAILLNMGLGAHYGVIPYTIIFLWLLQKSRWLSFLAVPVLSIPIFYSGIGMEYGEINLGHVASLFETNTAESQEFLSMLPIRNYMLTGILFALLLAYTYSNRAGQGSG
jgi:glucan phosphoethanolaminetransferase (alkaline phosphatase superfamily)